jgi:hypothetical protein
MNAVGVRRTNLRFVAHAAFFASVLLVPAFVSAQGAAKTAGHAAPRASSALAVLPGFEELDDGSTRLFVDLSAPAAYETKAAKGTFTYVLKEAQVAKRNNCNPLVTIFFNTPVTKAQLVPHGRDLWFVVDVRAPAEPSVSVDAKDGGGATLSIRFPKGDYLPARSAADGKDQAMLVVGSDAPAAPVTSASAAPSTTPTSRPHGSGGGARSHGHGASASGH